MSFTLYDDLTGYEEAVRNRIRDCIGNVWGGGQNSVYLYGYGMMGRFVYEQLKDHMIIQGYIDGDKDKQGRIVEGNVKIYSLEEVAVESIIIIASLAGWHEIFHKCLNLGYVHCCHYEELAFYDHTLPHWEQAFDGMAESVLKNKQEYDKIYHLLGDARSKDVFKNVLYFRLTMDLKYSEKAHYISIQNGEKPYFDSDIVYTSEEEVFVDCGGFQGETTEDFIEYVSGKYKKVYCFEPDRQLAEIARNKFTEEQNRVEILPYGVGKEEDVLSYRAVGNGSGNFADDGTERIRVVKIDDIVKEKATYIKMDIEGMEEDALAGAQETIKNIKPKLAISAYHKCDDIFRITEQILSYRQDYRIYMRHYGPHCSDTILYFI